MADREATAVRKRVVLGAMLAFATAPAVLAQDIQVRAFQLQHRELDLELLDALRLILIPGESIEAFPQTNAIVVKAGVPTLTQATRYLELLDAPPEEGNIDAARRGMLIALWRFENAADLDSKLKALDDLDKATMAIRVLLWKERETPRE